MYENCSHFWEIFRFRGVDVFDFLGSKNIFNLCHHIEFNTQNPNPILKITIPFTKTPKKPKHFRKKRKISKIHKIQNFQKPKFLFCILYTFHNSYFSYVFFVFWTFWKNWKFSKIHFFKNSIFYFVLCIRSIIHIFIIFIFYIFLYN